MTEFEESVVNNNVLKLISADEVDIYNYLVLSGTKLYLINNVFNLL